MANLEQNLQNKYGTCMKNNISGDEVKVNRYHLDAESDSNRLTFHQLKQYHIVVRSLCIPSVNTVTYGGQTLCIPPAVTVPHGGQIIAHSSSQHSTTWWSDHCAFHQLTQYHIVVGSSCIPQVNTVPHSGRIIVHSTS